MTSWYPLLKTLHIVFALLSLGGFIFRGVLMWRRSGLLQRPLLRRLPHINDTLLFLLGLSLWWLGPWSFADTRWLQLKLLLLLLYIGLGFVALHRGRFSRAQRLAALLSAVTVFLSMLWLAHFKPL